MGRISQLVRRTTMRFIPGAGRPVLCTVCSRPAGDGVRMISGSGVYLCSRCFARAAEQLAPRRPPSDALRCRFCRQLRAPSDVVTIGPLTLCADCLGYMDVILDEDKRPS